MRPIVGYCAALTVAFAWLLGTAIVAPTAQAATITQITSFGSNPTGIGMYLYTPANVVAKPPILVGVHACHGKGLDVCKTGNTFAQQADQYGFLMICPSAISSDGCWDVHSMADLSHTGSGDASGIISMVNYVIQNKNGDASRVYVAGHSSGGMMTNVLLGSYPDVFKAGAAFAGVPFACFAQGSVDNLGWSTTCANGQVTMTGAQWGDLVRAAYPTFAGTRPRIQFWHGTTDATLSFHNFGEEIKEWTNVLGVSETPTSTENDAVQATWIRTRYADGAGVVQVEAIQETGQPHNLIINGAEAIRFFGLDGSNPVPDAGVVVDASPIVDRASPDAFMSMDSAGNAGGATATGGATAIGSGGAQAATGTGGVSGMTTPGSSPGTGGGILASGGSSVNTGGTATGGSSVTSPGTPDAGTNKPPSAGSGGSTGTTSATRSSSGCSLASENPHRFGPASLLFGLGLLIVGWRRRDSK